MRRLLTLFAVLLCASAAHSASFSWTSYGVVTPIRDQILPGDVDSGECWAFSAAAALETDYLLTTGATGAAAYDLHLSPQYIKDSMTGGLLVSGAIQEAVSTGTVLDSLDPLQAKGSAGTANLSLPYTVYRATSFAALPNDTAYLKSWMQQHGLIVTELDNAAYMQVYHTDTGWYDDQIWNRNWSIWGNHPVVEVYPWGKLEEHHPELNEDWYIYGYTSATWHVVDLIGWQDDASWAGGGYWIVKSSYPSSVGPWVPNANGYGEISYASLADTFTMMSSELGNPTPGRQFFGLDGPAGALTYNADDTVTVTGVFDANETDIPSGSGLNVGDTSAYFAPTVSPTPEPNSAWLLAGLISLLLWRVRK